MVKSTITRRLTPTMKNYELTIAPKQKWHLVSLKELWRYRELFFILSWRDIKVRYKQTFLGIIWVIFQPLATTGIFTIFFGRLANIPSGNLPYELFVFIGLVFWIFFSASVTAASNSMVENVNIIKKVYFPREILPISAIITSFVDFAIAFLVVLIVTFYFGFVPSPTIFIYLPIVILIIFLTSSGIGLFLASFNVRYRDVRYILPFFIQSMLFLTPVIYPSAVVRDSFRPILAFNPMTGVIETMRIVLSGSGRVDLGVLFISSVFSLIVFVIGLTYFRVTERFFADIA
ncbi:MAG: ABC transporter permease [Candidatus Curtissbacteria bacterium]|nr:ABC transporter permease [Candidatus Curtissbacteria bacterium]